MIRRDDSIDCMSIKQFPRSDAKKLMIVADLETFYEKSDEILSNIFSVRQGIYKILEKNSGTHTNIMHKLLENKKDIIQIPEQVQVKKEKYDKFLMRLENMLSIVLKIQSELYDKIAALDDNKAQGITSDIDRVHAKNKLQEELSKIEALKIEISGCVISVRTKRENIMIEIDKIMFDNTVMFDNMVRNFAMLKKLI